MAFAIQDNALQSVSGLFGTLSHPIRLKLLGLLGDQEMDVTHLQEMLGVSQSSVSQHLGLLKQNGLVVERRQGKHVFYSIKNPHIKTVIANAVQLLILNSVAGTEALESLMDVVSILGA